MFHDSNFGDEDFEYLKIKLKFITIHQAIYLEFETVETVISNP